MRTSVAVAIAALLAIGLPCKAEAWLANEPVPNLGRVTVEPSYGYRVGDLVTVRAFVSLPEREDLTLVGDEAELPEWLELVRAEHRRRRGYMWELRWVYQIFYVPGSQLTQISLDGPGSVEVPGLVRISSDGQQATAVVQVPEAQAMRIPLPPRILRFRGQDGQEVTLEIPAVMVELSPLTGWDDIEPEPDWQPPVPSWPWWPWTLAALIGIGIAAWDEAKRRRKAQPFRQLQASIRLMADPRQILLVMHRALDARAGRAVLSPQDLVQAWPQTEQAASLIERFFALSGAVFYAESPPAQEAKACVLKLCRALQELDEHR